MKLEDALRVLAEDLSLDAEELIAYAAEDDETGWDFGQGTWPCGSMFASEGKILYALTRAMRPAAVLEFGTMFGCSAKHILKALVVNKHGKLVSVDPAPQVIEDRFNATEGRRWKRIVGDGETAKLSIETADIVLEDAIHSAEMTEALVRRGLDLGARIMLSHDGAHNLVGQAVRDGFSRAAGDFKILCTEDSDCGFAYTVRPGGA